MPQTRLFGLTPVALSLSTSESSDSSLGRDLVSTLYPSSLVSVWIPPSFEKLTSLYDYLHAYRDAVEQHFQHDFRCLLIIYVFLCPPVLSTGLSKISVLSYRREDKI